MRFAFKELPGPHGGDLVPRPVVPVYLEGLDAVAQLALVDTGALRTRFDRRLAELAGLDLSAGASEHLAVGGLVTHATAARVTLRVGSAAWDAPVWFCEPWPFGFQLFGLEGFLRHFRVTVCAADDWLSCEPEAGATTSTVA